MERNEMEFFLNNFRYINQELEKHLTYCVTVNDRIYNITPKITNTDNNKTTMVELTITSDNYQSTVSFDIAQFTLLVDTQFNNIIKYVKDMVLRKITK